MKPKRNDDKLKAYSKDGQMQAAPGYKMAIQPKKGESATKNLTVGRTSAMVNNGIYAPKPTEAAKTAAPAPAQKSNWKAPSSKQTGMSKSMKTGGKGRKC
jgi:hypothetical protein